MAKITLAITIDEEIAKSAKAKLLGEISAICETALATAIEGRKFEKTGSNLTGVPRIYLQRIKKTIEKNVKKDADYELKAACLFWANWINNKCGSKLTAEDIENYALKKER